MELRPGHPYRFEAMTAPEPTAAALRAVADLIESAGAAGISVTCGSGRIDIQVCQSRAGAATRAATVAALAAAMGSTVLQDDAAAVGDITWLHAHGQADGLPVKVWTELQVIDQLARTPDRRLAQASPGAAVLPPGWRWVTELDVRPRTEEH